jgi:hypothetical protein
MIYTCYFEVGLLDPRDLAVTLAISRDLVHTAQAFQLHLGYNYISCVPKWGGPQIRAQESEDVK